MLSLRIIPGIYSHCPSLSSSFQLQNRPLSLRCCGIFLTELTQSVSLFFLRKLRFLLELKRPSCLYFKEFLFPILTGSQVRVWLNLIGLCGDNTHAIRIISVIRI